MPAPSPAAPQSRVHGLLLACAVAVFLAVHVRFATVGWTHEWLPGHEFRQTQTALSTWFIQRDHDFSLAYPTPLFGPPWTAPMEFPLYEWTVVALSDATGWPLVQAARAVSLGCFYLMLPALYLVLGQLGVGRRSRIVALLLVLSAPLYVFYSRAFLIESMALMLSLWFLLGFMHFVRRGHLGGLLVALVAGSLAGLTKVTTFATYGLAAAIWSIVWLRRPRGPGAPARMVVCSRALGAVAVPLIAAVAWVVCADRIKGANPATEFLQSRSLTAFTFGSLALRLTREYWFALVSYWQHVLLPVLPAALLLGAGGALDRRTRGFATAILAVFLAAQLILANLYFLHDYYLYANGVLLLAAVAVATDPLLAGGPRAIGRRALALGLLAAIVGWQWRIYARDYLPLQRLAIPGGGEHTVALRAITDPDDVMVVVGQDWSSIMPYYSQRRAVMIPTWREENEEYLTRAFTALQHHRVGVLAISTGSRSAERLLQRAEHELRIVPVPGFTHRGNLVFYFHEALQPRVDDYFARNSSPFHELTREPRVPAPSPFPLRDFVVPNLADASPFAEIDPTPVLFRTALDYPQSLDVNGKRHLNAHAPSELVFALKAGSHHLHAQYGLPDVTFAHPAGPHTDGVRFSVLLRRPRHAEVLLGEAWLDPLSRPDDRGIHTFELDFSAPEGATLVLQTAPGPTNNNAFDWSYWGEIKLR